MDARMLKSAAPPSLREPFTWAEQPEKTREPVRKRKINSLALKPDRKSGEVCCSLVVVRLRGSYLNNALKGGV
jgi:hypothetical protein